jgi:alkylation response protein AidB-like acyl-CoA dehydrogenase
VERFWRDARLMTITEGTTEIQLTIIAREIGL